MAVIIVEVRRGWAKVVKKPKDVVVLIKDFDISKEGKNIKRFEADEVIEDGQEVSQKVEVHTA